VSWPLRRREPAEHYTDLAPGDWWTRGTETGVDLSPEFMASGRVEIIWIRLPGNCGVWSPDINASGDDSGWTLCLADDGSPLTATPSVNANNCYHGWLKNGELTDDCEGRTYLTNMP
jgi:hypothetical protein